MRILGSAILAFVLVACAPTVPDSAAGVGFAGYSEYELERLAREKELERLARLSRAKMSLSALRARKCSRARK